MTSKPSSSLAIHDLKVRTRIGVPESERAKPQDVLISVWLSLDTRVAAKDDDVKQSINYFDLTEDIKALAQTERKTIERFAEEIATLTLEKYKPESVTVEVRKFPTIENCASVSLTITRP